MRDNVNRVFTRYQRTFAAFTAGQKLVAVIGTAALLLAGFMVFRWASTPSYAPLFSNLSSSDASAVVDKLTSDGIPYQLTNGGGTVMVPQSQVYSARIKLAGAGLPTDSSSGYSILDKGGLGQSQFQQDTNFKRAMESELDNTIKDISGVQNAIVHLAIPQQQVFATTQQSPTASVLLALQPGVTLNTGQVQAITHLVASSIQGMNPTDVTVTDSAGNLLSATNDASLQASNQAQQISDYESQKKAQIQSLLDSIVGPGNSSVAVTANLDFDKTDTQTKTYTQTKGALPLSQSTDIEKYNGVGAGSSLSGVVGPNGQMGTTGTSGTSGNGTYSHETQTSDNAVNTQIQDRQSAPGSVKTLTIGVALNAASARLINPTQLQNLIAAGAGIDPTRGDRIDVTTVPFDQTAKKAAAAELAASNAASAHASQMTLIRNAGLVLLVALMLLLAWFKGRKRAQARADATSYVVEQLRQDALERAQAQAMIEARAPATLALESTEQSEDESMRDELAALVERQPEDVAALLRGWLVEPR
jgi:flagellar M-ring protein FliF